MLGYAILHFMHEQGMPGPSIYAQYSQYTKPDEVEKLRDKAIEINGILLDPVRYTRETYIVVDLYKLHHQIALNLVDQELMKTLRDCAPEVYLYAKNNSTGNGGSFIRKTIGWNQLDINRKLWDSII